jgi:glycosyltransferase involved in cell wall biosynthesis
VSMRVLHCIPSMGGGGAERQLGYLGGALTTIGWEVHVALLSGGPNLERLQMGGAVVHQVGARGNHDPAILAQLLGLMRRLQPDVVETWLPQMDILGGIAARLTRRPWILQERSGEPAYPPTLKHRARVAVAAGSSAVISNSGEGDRYWQRRLRGRVRRYIIRNAVPLKEMESASPATGDEIGIEPEERLVLYVGRLAPEKNLAVLVSALRVVLADPRNVAALCGEGPLRSSVAGWLAEAGVADRVRLPGYVSNVWSWLKRADVFVSPSMFEGHPNAVVEAMACGCPLVVSDIPAHREFLDEESAVLVRPDQPAQLAEAIAHVLTSGEVARSRAAKARATTATWSIGAISRRHAEAYYEVLADRRERGGSVR